MSIYEVYSTLNYRSLMNKSKSDLTRMVLDYACMNETVLLSKQEAQAEIERLTEAVQKLLACPAIADEDFSDPVWGCEITREAEAFARAALDGEEPRD